MTNTELFMLEVSKYDVLPDDEIKQLIRLGKNGDVEARNKIVNHNLKLVVSVVKNNLNRGCEFMDLATAGMMGVDHAVDKYDLDSGIKFSTYAYNWVQKYVFEEIKQNGRPIRLPGKMMEKGAKIFSKKEEFIEEYGREPDYEELSEYMDFALSADDIADVMDIYSKTNAISLDEQTGDDTYLYDIVPDRSENEDEDDERYGDFVAEMLNSLDERERYIVDHIFGYNGCEIKSISEIAEDLGIGYERARQIYAKVKKDLGGSFSDPRGC